MGVNMESTRDKPCTERQEDSSIALRKNTFPDAPNSPRSTQH